MVAAIGIVALLVVAFVIAPSSARNRERAAWCAEYLAQAPSAADSLRLYRHPVHPCPMKGARE